jgi:hypothetical protein
MLACFGKHGLFDLTVRFLGESALAHIAEQTADGVDNLGDSGAQLGAVLLGDLAGIQTRTIHKTVGVAQALRNECERVRTHVVVELARSGLPTPHRGVMVRPVPRAGTASHRFEEIRSPNRSVHDDGSSGVDGTFGGRGREQADLEAHAALGPFLSDTGLGVSKVQIADGHTDFSEPEYVQH